MTEVDISNNNVVTNTEEKVKPYNIIGSMSLLRKYKKNDKELTVYLTDGTMFTGKIRWYDDYAIKIILTDGSITIPIHNIIQYECEHFVPAEGEAEPVKHVFKGASKSTGKEREQLKNYKKAKELLEFHMENGAKITGRLRWFIDHMYSVRPDKSGKDYQLIKRHILYYKKVEIPQPERDATGIIKVLIRGKDFGFITMPNGEDIFFHISQLVDGVNSIKPGQTVRFNVTKGKKGNIAVNIK